MICPQCKGPHTLSQCPNWRVPPSDVASAYLGIFAPWIKWNLMAWHVAVKAGSMLP